MNTAPRVVYPSERLEAQIMDLARWADGSDLPVEVKFGGTVFIAKCQEVIKEGQQGKDVFAEYCRTKIDLRDSENSYIARPRREKRRRINRAKPVGGSNYRSVKGR